MSNIYNQKSAIAEATDAAAEPLTHLGGSAIGAVPKGKTRFVTFVKLTNTHSAAVTVQLGEGDLTSTLDRVKDQQNLAAGDTIMYPDSPNQDSPLFSIASEKFLVLDMVADTADVTIGYFDE